MKVLVFGAKGYIGSEFILNTKHTIFIAKTRPENYEECIQEIRFVNPDSVISFIGRTHGINEKTGEVISTIDYLELPGKLKENLRDNLVAPLNLAHICETLDIHFVYLGTGCIYTYKDNKTIFTEDDIPNFTGSSYSTVKGQTDQLLRRFKNTLQLRIRMPIFYKKGQRNFIDKIVSYKNICSIPNSMTVMDDMWKIINKMIEVKETGVYNFTNPGVVTHSWILNIYKELINNEHTWNEISYEDQMKIIKSERSNNELDVSKLQGFCQKHGIQLLSIYDSVLECIKMRIEE
jgi:dTDP-4-dehydrorhamnose reductase